MYFNRELSWLKFNERVLREAEDPSLPILERLKFSAIFSSNLDEFFMVRVASIKEQINIGYQEMDPSGHTPEEIFRKINKEVKELIEKQYIINQKCIKDLTKAGIEIIKQDQYTKEIIDQLKHYFVVQVFPVLTPMAVDFSRPFPLVSNKNMYIAVKLMVENNIKLALVQVPSVLNRLVQFESSGNIYYVLLEDIIMQFIDQLFVGHEIIATSTFRITRNGDLHLIEDDADDLLMVIEEAIKLRKWGEAIRLEISEGCDPWLLEVLTKSFHLEQNQVYHIKGTMDMTMLFKFRPQKKFSQLKEKPYKPKKMSFMEKKNIFKSIRDGDIFLHHPYESFDYIVEFIKKASKDPRVLAIKQTLYRVSGESEIVKALAEAADRGKQVTVLVELMARFDEENNINWAKKLEQRGVHVIYGIYGLKTHSKITLIVRREMKKIRRYVHLGTGNYNDQTAKLYTDMGLLTCKESFGSDASIFFNMVSGFTNAVYSHTLTVAPYDLRQKFYALIDREIKHAQNGKKGLIIAKMNSLVDKGIVDKLYEASSQGVKIKLIVRGICTLIPGIEGLSENIKVISIVGEFLEHSRIYYFNNNNRPETYLSSADWMTRNLNRRIEILFPIEDKQIAERIYNILDLYLRDNRKAWQLLNDGTYEKKTHDGNKIIAAQEILKTIMYENNQDCINEIKERM